jgi:hypothetical protein
MLTHKVYQCGACYVLVHQQHLCLVSFVKYLLNCNEGGGRGNVINLRFGLCVWALIAHALAHNVCLVMIPAVGGVGAQHAGKRADSFWGVGVGGFACGWLCERAMMTGSYAICIHCSVDKTFELSPCLPCRVT